MSTPQQLIKRKHTYTHTYVCIYIYIHTHTHTHIYIYIYIYIIQYSMWVCAMINSWSMPLISLVIHQRSQRSDLADEETTGFRFTQRGLQRWKRGIDETIIVDIEIVAEKIWPARAKTATVGRLIDTSLKPKMGWRTCISPDFFWHLELNMKHANVGNEGRDGILDEFPIWAADTSHRYHHSSWCNGVQ